MGVLHHIYDPSYDTYDAEFRNHADLLPHALVYNTAIKFEVYDLEWEATARLEGLLGYVSIGLQFDLLGILERCNFLATLRTIFMDPSTHDTWFNCAMVDCCVEHLEKLKENQEFVEIVAKVPDLGAWIIKKQVSEQATDANGS